jgi:hypothetical protein
MKWNTNVKEVNKIKNEKPTFLETMLLLKVKRQVFVDFFFKVWIHFRIWIRNRNRNVSKVGGTAINHYGSTTLVNVIFYNFL